MEYIKEHNSDYSIENLYEGIEEKVQQILVLFIGIFIVIVLILLFVSPIMSKHIVRERMSELGTLRSIGATKTSVAFILFCETMVSLFISTAVAFGSAILLYVMIFRFIIAVNGEEMDIMLYIIQPGLFLLLLYPVTLLMAKRTAKKIDKMNTAAQMKYE